MTDDTLDFTPPAQIVHCACCKALKAVRTPIDANSVRIGKRHPKTSQIAAERVLSRTGTKRRTLFDLIQGAGARGLCDHEIESITGWHTNTSRSTRNGLMNDGWIVDSGNRRKTPQGNGAIVWVTA